MSRPSLIWSSVAAILASRAGLRKLVHMTIVPSWTRGVASAIAVRIVQHSWIPVGHAVLPEEEVIEDPDGVEAGRLCGLRDGADLGVAPARRRRHRPPRRWAARRPTRMADAGSRRSTGASCAGSGRPATRRRSCARCRPCVPPRAVVGADYASRWLSGPDRMPVADPDEVHPNVTELCRHSVPGMGAIPFRGGTTFRVLAHPHAGRRLRDRPVRRLGRGRDGTLGRDGDGRPAAATWSRRRRRRSGSRRRVPVHRSAPPDGDLSRLDPYARQVTNSIGNAVVYDPTRSTGATTTSGCRPGTTSSSTSCTSGRSTGTATARRRLRPAPCAARATCASSAIGASRSCRRSSSRATSRGATTRPTCSRSSRAYGGPDAFKRFIRAAHAHGHRGHRRRRLQPPRPVRPRPVAVRRLGRGRRRRHLLLQRRARA